MIDLIGNFWGGTIDHPATRSAKLESPKKRRANHLSAAIVIAFMLGLFASGHKAFAWNVCVNPGTPSPQVYGQGTQANPYVVCLNDSFQITFTATVCNNANENGECLPTGVTFTWPAPYPATGPTDTIKFGPFTQAGLNTYTIKAIGTAAGFKTSTGGPCPNPPPAQQTGSDTVYIVATSNTAWTPVSDPPPNFPAAPQIPDVVATFSTISGCHLPAICDVQAKYVSSAQPDIQNGSWHYSGCGGAVTATHTVTTVSPTQVTLTFGLSAGQAAGSVSIPVNLGNTTQNYTSTFTAGPQPGLEFRIMRRTPAWYLNGSVFYRATACYVIFPGPYGPWQFAGQASSPDFDQLPGTVWDVWSQCCQ